MIQTARTWRVFAGGMAAGFIGVVLVAAGTASADPLPPPPPVPAPVPVQVAGPPAQNLTVLPGGGNNRFTPAQAPAPIASPMPIGVPGSTAVAPMPSTATPAVSGTLRDYLHTKGVQLEAQRPQGFTALDITLPVPPRWTQVPDPNVPDAFAVIADRLGNSVYTSNAQVVVYKLVGDFDPAEAITHGYVDSQKLFAWQTTNASMANFGGFPSSIIEGTYRENDMTLNTSRRHTIATAGADRYLVSLSVTTALSQAVADGPATNAIINGFQVAAHVAPTPGTVQAPRSAPVGLPGQPTPGHPPLGIVTPIPPR
ncbi:LpqN/LpqT family lipoprotein [Mycobacterium decipiens]|uniref:Proline-rich 28 kDa antigen n=1 Tax=Mycobacterium decipiens TaxID=1430326 RepID=A0A1X2LTU4_9MYCO|nr:LpqN/LpqT family lipoprotein [Mycobacterium decipiens]OSC40294.1 hypothetical protein B8W66_13355 [Mycobacterium decipiens]